jgi:hypothetical protein
MTVTAQKASRAETLTHQRVLWQAPHYVRSLAMAIPAAFLGFQISGWVFAMKALQEGRVDFRAQYTAGYLVRSGNAHRLYDYAFQLLLQNDLISPRNVTMPFDHLAYEALFFVPFSFFRFKAAYFTFLAVNVGALMLSILKVRRWTPTLNHIYGWLTPVMVIAFLPTGVALMQGQESVLLLLFVVIVFAFLESGKDFLAGMVLSLGMFKFQIALPIALLFLLWGKWRLIVGFSFSTIGLLTGSFALVGGEATRAYLRLLTSMSVGLHSAADQGRLGVPPAAMPNLRGLVIGLLGIKIPGFWQQLAIAILSVLVITAAFWRGRHVSARHQLLIAILAASLVSYHSLIHDMAILMLPVLVLFDECIAAVPDGPSVQRNVATAAALLFTAPVLFCFLPTSFYIAGIATCALLYAVLRWDGRSQFSYSVSVAGVVSA